MSEAANMPADPRWSSTQSMILSLKQDYDAGRLPAEAIERLEALRDEFYASARQRGLDLVEEVGPNLDRFIADLKNSIDSVMVQGDEVLDSTGLPTTIRAVDATLVGVEDPIVEAAVDIGRSVLDFAADLVELRAQNDPTGEFAELLRESRAELAEGRTEFEDSVETALESRASVHADMQGLADRIEASNAEHGSVQIINKTSVDPHLPEQIEHETGQVEA